MKTFKQYLTESTKEHKFTLRFCCDLDEAGANRIETFLSKYDLKSMSKTSTTPITKNPMFFKDVENSKVSKIDIVTGYPLSADILRQQLSDLLGMYLTHIVVHPDGWEPKEEVVDEDKEALLASDYDETSDDGKTYGKTFVDKFLLARLIFKFKSFSTCGCILYNRCAHPETLYPSVNSLVTAAPPIWSFASKTKTFFPAFASKAEQARPLCPAPITIASYLSIIAKILRYGIFQF